MSFQLPVDEEEQHQPSEGAAAQEQDQVKPTGGQFNDQAENPAEGNQENEYYT